MILFMSLDLKTYATRAMSRIKIQHIIIKMGGNIMELLKDLKHQFDNYKIVDLQDRPGFIVFSKETYTADEKKQLFERYINEKCLQNFDVTNEPHSRYLYIEKIIDDKNNKCIDRKGILTYIMLNPSYARSEKSDQTMDKARKWATRVTYKENVGYQYFAVINLFSYRHHKPSELKKILQNNGKIMTKFKQKDNKSFIQKYLESKIVKDFIIAYGVNKEFRKNKENLLKLLKDKSTNLMTFYSSREPFHISCRKKVYDNNHKLHLYPINIY